MSSCQPCMFVLASGGSQGHPMTPNTMSLLYDNSSAHGIFTFHIGIRCSTLDCMSIWFTFLAAGMYLKNTLEYLGQAHYIRRAVVHPRLQYLLGLPLVSHMSRVKCFVSMLLCSLFFFFIHQCEFLQNTSEHMCLVPFVFWRYTHRRCKSSVSPATISRFLLQFGLSVLWRCAFSSRSMYACQRCWGPPEAIQSD